MTAIRDGKTKKAFVKFLNERGVKHLRFWQALAAFTNSPFILTAESMNEYGEFSGIRDTFYIESDRDTIQ